MNETQTPGTEQGWRSREVLPGQFLGHSLVTDQVANQLQDFLFLEHVDGAGGHVRFVESLELGDVWLSGSRWVW